MKKLVLLLLMASSLMFASNYKYEITPTIGGVLPEGNLDLANQLSYGLRFGINVNSMVDQIEFGIDRSSDIAYKNSNKKTDINRYFVNFLKFYPLKSKLSLYTTIGLGYENITNKFANNDNSGFVDYGVGLKYRVNDNFSLRAEVRDAIKVDHGDNNLFYTIGFTIPFGKIAEPMAKQAPTPAPKAQEPAPVVVPVVHDDDHDGVINSKDMCPNTPKYSIVNAKGCEIDSDQDGVVNSKDMCPNTPVGDIVNANGCVKIIHLHVTFDVNKADISQNYMIQIKKVAKFMNTNKNYKVALDGYTDSTGSKEYNQQLSVMRANKVAITLENLGINPNRVIAKGFGESNPIATNKTKEGRAQNRRVDAKFKNGN